MELTGAAAELARCTRACGDVRSGMSEQCTDDSSRRDVKNVGVRGSPERRIFAWARKEGLVCQFPFPSRPDPTRPGHLDLQKGTLQEGNLQEATFLEGTLQQGTLQEGTLQKGTLVRVRGLPEWRLFSWAR